MTRRITVFTSNQPRHVALIESLASVCDEVYAVQECTTVLPGRVDDFYRKSEVMQRYFQRVIAAEAEVFGSPRFPGWSGHPARALNDSDAGGQNARPTRVHQLALRMGDLSMLDLDTLGPALTADLFVVFGASYIRGPLCDLLVKRRAVNIHMGVSPYYRGSSTNFWALYDRRPGMVGATIHVLTAGLDSGPILFHALPAPEPIDPFLLGMKAVQAAHSALVDAIATGEVDSLDGVEQDKRMQYRYSRAAEFTDDVAAAYLANLLTPGQVAYLLTQRDPAAYVRPRFARLRRVIPPRERTPVEITPDVLDFLKSVDVDLPPEMLANLRRDS